MTPLESATVSILGAQDAIFSPLRDIDRIAGSNFLAARVDFLTRGGLPIHSQGARQAFARQLEELQRQKLVTVSRQRRTMFPMVRLSLLAETLARSLCGLPSIAAGWVTVERVAELADAAGREWVPEFVLAKWPGPRAVKPGSADMRELVLIEDMALPALARGWIDSNATALRHVCYRVLPAGRNALMETAPADPKKSLFEESALNAYQLSFDVQRHTLMTSEPANQREIGELPLSTEALCWP